MPGALGRAWTGVCAVMLCFVVIACSPASQPPIQNQTLTQPTRDMLNKALGARDPWAVVAVVRRPIDLEQTAAELASLRWESVPPVSSTALQHARFRDVTLGVDAEFRGMVITLGELYDEEKIDQPTYLASIRLIDAALRGLLASREWLYDPSIDSTAAVLTYAALSRAAMSQELLDRGLDAPLTPDHIQQLSDIARYENWDRLDEFP